MFISVSSIKKLFGENIQVKFPTYAVVESIRFPCFTKKPLYEGGGAKRAIEVYFCFFILIIDYFNVF